ncbi:E3 ubiquitin-protein ligase [Panicum miliaceum]|uniref:E3 ubiquitin-protein ligase n=1 Tax=Panicum miliaceum TaxID=4540 RepID=A0A3L6TRU9_PANMI|nr:E3 ubiquitin-protein ligase [Panicum miliaceum]
MTQGTQAGRKAICPDKLSQMLCIMLSNQARCFMLWEPFGQKVELVLDLAVENDYEKVAPLAEARPSTVPSGMQLPSLSGHVQFKVKFKRRPQRDSAFSFLFSDRAFGLRKQPHYQITNKPQAEIMRRGDPLNKRNITQTSTQLGHIEGMNLVCDRIGGLDWSTPASMSASPDQEAVREEPDEEAERDEAYLVAPFTPESVMSFAAARSHEFHLRRTQSAMDTRPDRHTLRLPEHVMKELAAVRRHRRAASLAGYPDAVERTPRWLASFWRSVSWQRQGRTDPDAPEEHGGSTRVVPITGAPEERPSGSGPAAVDDKEISDLGALSQV